MQIPLKCLLVQRKAAITIFSKNESHTVAVFSVLEPVANPDKKFLSA